MKNALVLLALTLAMPVGAQSFERLAGQYSEIKEKRTAVAKRADEWQKLWAEHNPNQPAPALDFDRVMVVAVFLGEQRRGGTKVELTVMADPLNAEKVVVFYKEVAPAKPAMTQVVARPFEMRVIPKADSVAFEADTKARILIDRLQEFAKNPGFDRF